MNIFLNNELFYIENATSEKIIDLVNIHSKDNNIIPQYLELNGEVIYEWDTFVNELDLTSVDQLRFKLLTPKEAAIENLMDINNYLKNAITVLPNISQKFYAGNSTKQWQSVIDLIDGLSFVNDSIKVIQPIFGENAKFVEVQRKLFDLVNVFPELEQALVSQDEVLIADLLKFEFTPLFEQLSLSITLFLEESEI